VGEFDTIDEVINFVGPKFDADDEDDWNWMEEIKDPQYWSSEGFEDNLLRFNIGGNYEVVDLDGEVDEFNREENRKDLARDERRDNIDYARSKRYEDEEGAEVPERTKLLIQLVADGYVRLHKVIENEETGKKEHHYQVLAPWMGDTNFPILKAQGWKEVPFPSIRLTLDSPGTASVQLRPPYTDIQTYLDLGYKVVEDYTKATQSEDNEENEDENLEVTRGDTSPKGFMDEVEHTEDAEGKTLTLNEEEINVVQEALLRLEPESFWQEGGSKDEFYNKEEVDRMLYIAQDILKKSGVE
jgi:hypothetical protein